MKKLLLVILIVFSNYSYAETVYCPTSAMYSVYGTEWTISLKRSYQQCNAHSIEGTFRCNEVSGFLPYHPSTKQVDSDKTWKIDDITFSYWNIYSTSNNWGIVLHCEGNYSSNESVPGMIWGSYHRVINSDATASLLTEHRYTTCSPIENVGFNCSPAAS